VLLVVLAVPSTALAEADNQLWTSSGFKYRMPRDLEFDAELHVRWDENVSEMDSVMPEMSLGYGPLSWLEFGVGFRHITEANKNDEIEKGHRVHAETGLDGDLGPVELSYRLRYQQKDEYDELEDAKRIRNRITLQYDTDTPFTPLLASELFTDPAEQPIEQVKVRLSAGGALKVMKRHRLKVRYHHQVDIGDDPDVERIISLGYKYVFAKPVHAAADTE